MWEVALGMFLLVAGTVIFLIYRAPEGYEDEKGFHYGKEESREVSNTFRE